MMWLVEQETGLVARNGRWWHVPRQMTLPSFALNWRISRRRSGGASLCVGEQTPLDPKIPV